MRAGEKFSLSSPTYPKEYPKFCLFGLKSTLYAHKNETPPKPRPRKRALSGRFPRSKVTKNHASAEGTSGREIQTFITKPWEKIAEIWPLPAQVYIVRTLERNSTKMTHAKGLFLHAPRSKTNNRASTEGESGRKIRILITEPLKKSQNLASAGSNLHRTHAKTKLHQNHARKKRFFARTTRPKIKKNLARVEGASGSKSQISISKLMKKKPKFGLWWLRSTPYTVRTLKRNSA